MIMAIVLATRSSYDDFVCHGRWLVEDGRVSKVTSFNSMTVCPNAVHKTGKLADLLLVRTCPASPCCCVWGKHQVLSQMLARIVAQPKASQSIEQVKRCMEIGSCRIEQRLFLNYLQRSHCTCRSLPRTPTRKMLNKLGRILQPWLFEDVTHQPTRGQLRGYRNVLAACRSGRVKYVLASCPI